MIAVECTQVTKSFWAGDDVTHALRGVDLAVNAGELMMLVGPSGSGKTTLISIVAGILNQDQGRCTLFGRDLKSMSEWERTTYRGHTVGFVFQAYNLIPTLTVRENVAIPLLIQGSEEEKALARAAVVLEQVGLTEKVRAFPRDLSGGQQQRVAIARALIHDPKLLVCDEPTSALDHNTGQKIMELFRKVALDGNRALIVVTHDNRIFGFADRIALMDDGRITRVVNTPAEMERQ